MTRKTQIGSNTKQNKVAFLARHKARGSELNILINLGTKPVNIEFLENYQNLVIPTQINSATFENPQATLGKYGGLYLHN